MVSKESQEMKSYLFLDYKNYYLDNILIQKKIPADFGAEYEREGSDFIFIEVSVRKKYEEGLLEAFEELFDKMLLLGQVHYEEYVNKVMTEFHLRAEKHLKERRC